MAKHKLPELESPENIDPEDLPLLRELRKAPPKLVLVASDLHLGPGFDATTGMYAAEENFLADEAFGRWLDSYHEEVADALLVLNGDTFDFLRITETPESQQDFRDWANLLNKLGERDRARDLLDAAGCPPDDWRGCRKKFVAARERRVGLRTDDYKTLWKLRAICDGHKAFFELLANWLDRGGRLIITRGNHDLEISWRLVRDAIRCCIVNRGDLRGPLNSAPNSIGTRLAFVQEWFTLKNLYFEHGHRYEELTRVPEDADWIFPRRQPDICLPAGSLVNRYFINSMERVSPFADNQKPATAAMMSILRARPLKVVGTFFKAVPFLLHRMPFKKYWWMYLLVLVVVVVPIWGVGLLLSGVSAKLLYGIRMDNVTDVLVPLLLILFPFLIPYLAGALAEVWRETRWFLRYWIRRLRLAPLKKLAGWLDIKEADIDGARDRLQEGMTRPVGQQRLYAVMGHTHKQRAHLLSTDRVGREQQEYYINSGTWIPLWHKNRPDLLGKVIYGFVEFLVSDEDGEYMHSLCMWDDHAGEPRGAVVLAPPADAH